MSSKKNNKYFINQKYKKKLESKIHEHKSYSSRIMFITKEPDPKHEREYSYRFMYYDKQKKVYIYYERPEVPYSIIEVTTPSKYSKRRKYLCKQANRKIRRQGKQSDYLYQNGEYKKVYDVPWNLD